MKDKTKEIMFISIVTTVFILVIGLFIYFIMIDSFQRNEKLNICANEYGYESRNKWDGGIMNLQYKFERMNDTHIACCKKEKYLSNGEVRGLNCTGLFAFEVNDE